jgi:uncharacterized protein involved in exopolysaccharide biosynthesis
MTSDTSTHMRQSIDSLDTAVRAKQKAIDDAKQQLKEAMNTADALQNNIKNQETELQAMQRQRTILKAEEQKIVRLEQEMRDI